MDPNTWNTDTPPVNSQRSVSASASADLSLWTPTPEDIWDWRKAAHLLRRSGFGLDLTEIRNALKSDPLTIVENLTNNTPSVVPLPPWQGEINHPDSIGPLLGRQLMDTINYWWVGMMWTPASSLREKMVLFWHNHFTSSFAKVKLPSYVYAQNKLFRDSAFGSFKQLTKDITVDPCMLTYLDLRLNYAKSPNENYARELLELFTLGEGRYADGTPHYTEQDIAELSRALTGWTYIGPKGSEFRPEFHDSSEKTIFGETARFGFHRHAERDPIDLIFEQVDPDYNLPRTAIFLCKKLYQWFVYHEPDMDIVVAMAKDLVENNWYVLPVVQRLLTSKHFFSQHVMGAMIKSPLDFLADIFKQFSLRKVENRDWIADSSPLMGQELYEPPSVKGWSGGRAWLDGSQVVHRMYPRTSANFDTTLMLASDENGQLEYDVDKVLDNVIMVMFSTPVSDKTRAYLLSVLLRGGEKYEWDPTFHYGALYLLQRAILKLPAYQLM